ncbi:hypothetical protein ASF36_19985 [Methylobacterium sp. Leaf90]|nr:hypothetical protein ASF36_19985 [Methylobacterium sp. Leaf90]
MIFPRPTRIAGGFGLVAVLLLPGVCGSTSAEVDCAPYLSMHSMLRRAQAQCAFTQFNPEIVATARDCYGKVGPGTGAGSMVAGAGEFDRMAALRGLDVPCSKIERLFPMAVR